MLHLVLNLPLVLAVLVPIMGILYPLALMAIISRKRRQPRMIEILLIWLVAPFIVTGLYITKVESNTRHR
jgi:hypothetical protein